MNQGGSNRKLRTNKRKLTSLLLASAASAGLAGSAYGQLTYTYTGSASATVSAPVSGNFSASASWLGGAAPQVTDVGDILSFGGTSTYTATDDITSLNLAGITLGGSGAEVLNSSGGSTITFASVGSTLPTISQAGSETWNIVPAIQLNNNLLFGGSGSGAVTFSGTLNGSGGITSSNSSAISLTGTNNTFSGGITLNGSGGVSIANASALGTGTLTDHYAAGGRTFFTIANNAATNVANNIVLAAPTASATDVIVKNTASSTTGTQLTLSGNISGGGPNLNLELNSNTGGDATTTYYFTGNNTFVAHEINLNRGSIVLGSSNAMGASTNIVYLDGNENSTYGDLRFVSNLTLPNPVQLAENELIGTGGTPGNTGAFTGTLTGTISGAYQLSKVGAGTLVLAGTNTYSGVTYISGGTLQVGNGSTSGNLGNTSSVSVGTGALLAFNRSDTFTFGRAINGAGGVNQIGSGTTLLTGSSTYTGPTTVSAGTLALGSGGSLGNTSINVSSGALFGAHPVSGINNVAGPVSLATGAYLDMLDGGASTLNLNATGTGLSLAGNDTLAFNVNFSSADALAVTNAVSVNGTNTINIVTPSVGVILNGSYPLLTAGSITGSGTFAFPNGTTTEQFQIGGQGTTYTASLANSSTGVQVTISGAITNFWKGSASSVWTGANWTSDQAGNNPTSIPTASSNVIFTVSGGGSNSSMTTLGQDFSIGSLSFTSDAGSTITIGGNNNLTIGAGGIAIASGTGGQTISTASLVLGSSQTWTNNGSQPFTVTAPITGASSNLILGGQGSFVLAGSNSYGTTTILAGTSVQVGNGGTTGSLGTGTVANNGTLTFNTSGSSIVSQAISGTGSITQNGTGFAMVNGPVTASTVASNGGMLAVNGSITATGAVTTNNGNISSGNISAGSIAANGGVISVTGTATTSTGITLSNNAMMSTTGSVNAGRNNPIVINDTSVFQSAGTLNLLVSQSTSVGNIDVSGSGTLRLTGTGNSYSQPDIFFGPDHSGTTYYGADITVGTLDLGSTQRFIVSNSGHNTAAKYLYPSVGVDAYISSNIIGAAGFNYMGNQEGTSGFYAPLVLQGSNTFTGPVEVDSGSIYLYSQNAWNGQNQLTLNNSAGLGTSYSHFFLLGNNATISNLASTGTTPANTGIGNSNPYSSVPTGANAATLTINQTANTTFGGVINDSLSDNYDASATSSSIYTPGSLSLAITGSGTLTLTGNANYSGSTTVGTGSSTSGLALAAGASLGNTNVTVNSGATFGAAPTSKIGFTTGSGNGASLTLNIGSVLDMTAGGTSTAVGNFNIHEPVGNGNTLLYINSATININASVTNADTIVSDGQASVSGSNIINVNLVGTASALPATYNIITAPGGLTGTFSFNNGTSTETIPYGSGTITLGLVNSDRNEELTIDGGAIAPLNAYWTNATGTGLWSTGGNGTGATNFSNDSQGAIDPLYVPGNITNVIFSAASAGSGPFNTMLGKDFTVNSLEFLPSATGGITVGGSNVLTINSGGITVDAGSGSHQISTGGLVIGQDQTWTNNSVNPITITSNVSGGNLTIGGIGTVILTSSNNSYGTTTINSGATLQLGNGGVTGNIGAGAIIDNGTLAFNHPGNTNYNASGITGTGTIAQAGAGILTIANLPPSTIGFGVTAGTLVLPSVNLADTANNFVGTGGTLVSNGTMDVGTYEAVVSNIITIAAGGTMISNGQLLLNGNANADHVVISGQGTLVLNNSGGSITSPDIMLTGIDNNDYGTGISVGINLSAGTHFIGGISANDSYGQYSDGDIYLTGSLAGPGNLVLYGLPYGSQFELRLGADNSAWTGSLTITGGDIALTATNALTANNSVTFNPPAGVTNNGTTLVSALYLFGNNITIGSLSGTGPGGMYIRDGALTTAAMLTVDQTVAGTFAGVISNGPNDYKTGTATTGALGITKTGPAPLTLTGANTYTGPTNVAQGQLIFARTGSGIQTASMPGGLNIGSGAVATFAVASNQSSRTLAVLGGLSLSGTSGAWTSKLDLGNNDMVVNNGSISTITNQIAQGYAGGTWNGANGIVSLAAAGDSTHLTALGAIQNSVDGTTSGNALYSNASAGSLGLFDRYAGVDTDVLVKYTYYGDANLDGHVDGSDYSLIDSSYESELAGSGPISGWYNGDFNYDGVVNGSDYTLIDNAFNSQGAALSVAVATAQVAGASGGSAVPEPASLAILGIGAIGLLGRRSTRRH